MPSSIPAKAAGSGPARSGHPASSNNPISEFFASKAIRETVESIAIAFVLAFLFRTFIAEAFVIPTGSMAPTLFGRHKDMVCPQCGCDYQTGDSERQPGDHRQAVAGTTCPMCRYIQRFEPDDPAFPSYTGDRILVSKFLYDISEPKRWDVFVFKFPGNAKQNYIKRLTGLPNETVRIDQGDLWVKKINEGDDKIRIARKPPAKIEAMLQSVFDTNYLPEKLDTANWPSRWQSRPEASTEVWATTSKVVRENERKLVRQTFAIEGADASTPAWLRYRHYVPSQSDWDALEANAKPEPPAAQLISDFYAYNAYVPGTVQTWRAANYEPPDEPLGMHWVSDLAVEADVAIKKAAGSLLLDLVKGGWHYRCSINVADGKATLSIVDIDGRPGQFTGDDGKPVATVSSTGSTGISGAGNHTIKLANVDHQLTLWVDGYVVSFDGPTTFNADENELPRWNASDEGDLAPAGIGSQGAAVSVSRLKLYRDIYYIAVKYSAGGLPVLSDYSTRTEGDFRDYPSPAYVRSILGNPQAAAENGSLERLLARRRSVKFDLQEDQFFALGDNSPQSQDARIWGPDNFVERRFLSGKAFFIYWPLTRGVGPLPFMPDFERIGFVR